MTKDEITPILIGKMLNIGGMLDKMGNQLLTPFNLNMHQYSILFSIWQAERVQQKDIVNKLLLEKSHVSKVIKKLHGMGLIDVEASSRDKRSFWISITDEGRTQVEACRVVLDQWNKSWTNDLDIARMKQILDSLAILQEKLMEISDSN